MELEERVEKVAIGISVTDAIEGYMRELSGEHAAAETEDPRACELLGIVEIMFLMAAADDDIAHIEMAQLRRSAEALPDLRAATDLHLGEALVEMASLLEREGWDRRLAQAAAALRTPEAKLFAFRLAAGIAFVDDFVARGEAAALEKLARALAIDAARSQAILRQVRTTLFGV